MKDNILIKGNQFGLSIHIDEQSTFDLIYEELKRKLIDGKNFFGNSKVVLSFEGKKLTSKEIDQLSQLVSDETNLQIICSLHKEFDFDRVEERIEKVANDSIEPKIKAYKDYIEQLESQLRLQAQKFREQDEQIVFHFSNLRSGQQIVTKSHVVILGDVNNGSRIESGGKVIVLGRLKGVVQAGLDPQQKGFVFALDMNPIQLRIGNAIGRASDQPTVSSKSGEAQIAYEEDGRIVIENIHNQVYRDLINETN